MKTAGTNENRGNGKKFCVRNVLKVFDLDACFAIQMKTDSALEKVSEGAIGGNQNDRNDDRNDRNKNGRSAPSPPGEGVAELFMANLTHWVFLLPRE